MGEVSWARDSRGDFIKQIVGPSIPSHTEDLCEYCGMKNDEGVRICEFCGAPIIK